MFNDNALSLPQWRLQNEDFCNSFILNFENFPTFSILCPSVHSKMIHHHYDWLGNISVWNCRQKYESRNFPGSGLEACEHVWEWSEILSEVGVNAFGNIRANVKTVPHFRIRFSYYYTLIAEQRWFGPEVTSYIDDVICMKPKLVLGGLNNCSARPNLTNDGTIIIEEFSALPLIFFDCRTLQSNPNSSNFWAENLYCASYSRDSRIYHTS